MANGLNTGLNTTYGINNKKHASEILEVFLTAVEINLLEEAFQSQHFEIPNKKTREIH